MNDCPEPLVDRKHQSLSSQTTHWASFQSRLPGTFIDAVRHQHPVKSAFTRPHCDRFKRVISWSRIDYILLKSSPNFKVMSAHTLFEAPGSDHRPVLVGISVPQPPGVPTQGLPETGAFTHRLHYATFELPEVEDLVAAAADAVLAQPDRAALIWDATKATLAGSLRAISKRRSLAEKAESVALSSSVELLESSATPLSPSQNRRWAADTARLQQITQDRTVAAGYRAHVPEIASEQSSAAYARSKIATRRKRAYIPGVQDPQNLADTTSDLDIALERTRAFFQAHYTPSAVDPGVRQAARQSLLAHLDHGCPAQAWCARRLQPDDAAGFDLPFTSEEVIRALGKTDLGRSPGPSGIPYEFYRADPERWASVLAAVFNNIWEREQLPHSMSEATVRLLFKTNKPGASVTNLAHYRPITLRETDYKILAKVLVARLNLVLGKILPPSQHGFVPGRSAAAAGTHVALLLEEIASRNLPDAALLSLDQRAAYDLVNHDWIFMVYRALGFPDRFLKLLTTIYDGSRLTARYNVNGFYTDPVSLLTGLGQGDPLSCASWNITFQPFLDALLLRNAALSLQSVAPLPRSLVLTHFAFADDTLLAVRSPAVLDILSTLSIDWKAATNGELNVDKTEATPIGEGWLNDPRSANVTTVSPEDPTVWVGFGFSATGNTGLLYSRALARLQSGISAVNGLPLAPTARARYANLHLTSKILHLLAYDIPPVSFIERVDKLLLDFVRGSGFHAIPDAAFALPLKSGGHGLVLPSDVVTATALQWWDRLARGTKSTSSLIALSSLQRTAADARAGTKLWTYLTTARLPAGLAGTRWSAIFSAAKKFQPCVVLSRLTLPELLYLPPSLPCLHPQLPPTMFRKYPTTLSLYVRRPVPGAAPQPITPPPIYLQTRDLNEWSHFTALNATLHGLLPPPSARGHHSLLPNPRPPRSSTFLTLGLSGLDSTKVVRKLIVPQVHGKAIESQAELSSIPAGERDDFWKWWALSDASARERSTHLRLAYGATPTRVRMHQIGRADSPLCLLCPRASRDTLHHYYFDCESSSLYWATLTTTLNDIAGHTLIPPLHQRENLQVLLGLPSVRLSLSPSQRRAVRVFFAVAFQELHARRWEAREGGNFNPERAAAIARARVDLRLARMERERVMDLGEF